MTIHVKRSYKNYLFGNFEEQITKDHTIVGILIRSVMQVPFAL